MSNYNILARNGDETVVFEYFKQERSNLNYQSEEQLEKQFINQLEQLSYEYVPIKTEAELILNLKKQIEKLNDIVFSDNEWERYFNEVIANKNEGIVEKTQKIQENYFNSFKRDNGQIINIYLINKKNIHKNFLQVINQYENNEGNFKNRYDVTILVNGLPLVHVELKRRGVILKEAFRQIERYKRESFWSNSGLYEYIQIFVISNGTQTKYYSNSTRLNQTYKNEHHIRTPKFKKNSNSFEFTSYWSDSKNNVISDLIDFTNYFFYKSTILNILFKYCVLTIDNNLMVMRPYQIVAAEKIINKVNFARENHLISKKNSGGYIWHTTGSGKTLTSFKTAQLLSNDPKISKVIFVVDRRDLDYQTLREFNKYQEDSVNANVTTEILKKQILDKNSNKKIIVTTIQKLDNFVKKNIQAPIQNEEVVLIFDECHRSQFGKMHTHIIKYFKKYYIFGFTGTPIFDVNANKIMKNVNLTTQAIFGERLHKYSIQNAIEDKNVLPFKIDYLKTVNVDDWDKIHDEKIIDIDRQKIMLDPRRIALNVEYVLKHYSQKTYRSIFTKSYNHKVIANIAELVKNNKKQELQEKRIIKEIKGFNSIFATHSIEAAIKYYKEFKMQQLNLNSNDKLKVALIYTFDPNNEQEYDYDILDEKENVNNLSLTDKEILAEAINDYNKMFKTNYSLKVGDFDNYYKDVSMRLKNRELDILIVVNMLLTGFDVPVLNTLWVDKNLKYHSLIQAFSRTNRILNEIKDFGNIVCFWPIKKNTDEAITLFSGENSNSLITLKSFDYYYEKGDENFESYLNVVKNLKTNFNLKNKTNDLIKNNQIRKKFVLLFNRFLKLRNLLQSFDEFTPEKYILNQAQIQDYQSWYLDIKDDISTKSKNKLTEVNDEIVFLTELIEQNEIDVQYILNLLKKWKSENLETKTIQNKIEQTVNSSVFLRSKKELIKNFIEKYNNVDQWNDYVYQQYQEELNELVEENNLEKEKVEKFLQKCFQENKFDNSGQNIINLKDKWGSRFGKNNASIFVALKEKITEILRKFFDKFNGVYS
ncbi:type I restriction endonuclease subunit R [Mycoplasma sp. 1018B]|uniref:type I restriction endonuclease subunit R n=1 Tax=Mycoplasma sp. 1018B TaxID=2967302 RepID=UPI00211CDCC5|nr:type I restriction endonuclease subunit R [Mycoplasma sp. 1018B]UUM19434.1 type I restriction endonuclease subunit R [Mycoplasma sp. 1018B]